MRSGDLKGRISFFRAVEMDGGYGSTTSGFNEWPDFTYSANIKPKLGGESVLAGRLTGRELVNVTVRACGETRSVTTDWKAKDERSGVEYNIRSIIDPDGKRQWLEMLCEQGVAV